MKLYNQTILGLFAGFIVMVISFVKYQIWMDFTIAAIGGIFGGLLIWGFAFTYNYFKIAKEEREELKNAQASLETQYNKLLSWKLKMESGK